MIDLFASVLAVLILYTQWLIWPTLLAVIFRHLLGPDWLMGS